MDTLSKQKINQETMVLNDILEQMDLTGIFRTFHPKSAKCYFQVIVEHSPLEITYQTTQSKSQQIKKYQSHTMHLFQTQCYETGSQPNEKIQNRNIWRSNNMLLTINGLTKKSQKFKKKKSCRQMKMKTQWLQIFGMLQKWFEEESLQQYRLTSRSKKIFQMNNITLLLRVLEKDEQILKPVDGRK